MNINESKNIIKIHFKYKRNILNEKNCFLKMSMSQAYSILKDLGLTNEDITSTYITLLDPEV